MKKINYVRPELEELEVNLSIAVMSGGDKGVEDPGGEGDI